MKRAARAIGTVVFDCDSTLVTIEGIDALARESREHQHEIERLTASAMSGEIPLEEAYARRLELLRPTRARIDALASDYIAALVPDARELVAALRSEGWGVRIASAGLRPAVVGLARHLGIPARHVAAVGIHFDEAGAYAGFDTASPLTRSGGKATLLAKWRKRIARPVVLVGDGYTDLEASEAVDTFIAYAGVAKRAAVVAGADACMAWRSLAPALPVIMVGSPPRDPAALALFVKGVDMMLAAPADGSLLTRVIPQLARYAMQSEPMTEDFVLD